MNQGTFMYAVEEAVKFVKKKRGLFIGLGVFFTLAIAGTILVFSVDCQGQKAEKKQVKAALKKGEVSYKHKPFITKLPIYVKPLKLPPVWNVPIKQATTGMNESLQAHTQRGPYFLEGSQYKGEGTLLVVTPAPKKHQKFRGKCQQMHIKDNKKVANKIWGWFEPSVPAIYLCMNRLKAAYTGWFQNHPPARAIRNFGRENIIRHELGHAFFPEHTTHGCLLMCAEPRIGKLSDHEIFIFKHAILPRLQFPQ